MEPSACRKGVVLVGMLSPVHMTDAGSKMIKEEMNGSEEQTFGIRKVFFVRMQ